MSEEKTHKCPTKSPLSGDKTIRELLKYIQQEVQKPGLAPDAVKLLQQDIKELEKEYDSIAELVSGYDKVYPDLQKTGAKYCEAERQWQSIKKWVEDIKPSSLPAEIRTLIDNLRQCHYRDETEVPPALPNTHPLIVLENARVAFLAVKSCLDQSKDKEEEAHEQYKKILDFKSKAEAWFPDLAALHKQAQSDLEKKKYKSLYATYREAEQVWTKIYNLPSTNPEWLRSQLIQHLKKWLIAKHERFLWHNDWLVLQQQMSDANTIYDDFTKNRRKNFLREAEDMSGKADGSGDGACQTESRAA